MPLTRLATALDQVLDRAIRATRADLGNIQILDRSADALRIIAQRGFRQPFLDFFSVVSLRESACGAALQSHLRTVVADVTMSPLYTPAARQAMLDAGARACQSTPIMLRGEVVGMISTHFRTTHIPSPREFKRVDALAREAASIIDGAGLVDDPQLEARTLRDELHDASDKTHIIRRMTK